MLFRYSSSRLISLIFFIVVSILFLAFTSDKQKNIFQKVTTTSNSYIIEVNNFRFPFSNKGEFGFWDNEVLFDGKPVIFSGGFLIAGYLKPNTSEEFLWANGVWPVHRISDYQPGKVGMNPDDPKAKIYVVSIDDKPFGESWQDWKNAVELGAEFYDGDGDGKYNPIDKNGNGIWDTNEDKPLILGDITAWCVFNDGVPSNNRKIFGVYPLGIEIQQTIWAFRDLPSLRNSVFIKYKLINLGKVAERLDSVIFSFVNDFDIGNYNDDYFGTDTLRNSVFAYAKSRDEIWGKNPPTIYSQLLLGPAVSIPGKTFIDNNNNGKFDVGDLPLDTAKILSPSKNFVLIPGYKNLNMSSSNEPSIPGPLGPEPFNFDNRFGIWNVLNGYDTKSFSYLRNPCTFQFGIVVGGIDCNKVNPLFIYSGDPVLNFGWINNDKLDVQGLLNIGRFTLEKEKPVELIFAYAVGRSNNPINSIVTAREVVDLNKYIFDLAFNVPQLPEMKIVTRSVEDNINLSWNTSDDFNYKFFKTDNSGKILTDVEFEGYELWIHKKPVNNFDDIDTTISKKLAYYDVQNDFEEIYIVGSDDISIKKILSKGIQLDKNVYSNPTTGKIEYNLITDPFTGNKLSKGQIFYFTLRKIFLDKAPQNIEPVADEPKTYLIKSRYSGISIINSDFIKVTVGENLIENLTDAQKKDLINRINVVPNPYIESNDNRLVERGKIIFTNLPEEVKIKIYSLSGILVKTLTEKDKENINSPFLIWDLMNENGLRVGDGVYLAVIKTKYGEKILKFSVVKQKKF